MSYFMDREPSQYAWTIDRVNVKELGDDMGEEVGTFGPRDASDELLDRLKRGDGHVFRMVDGDGIWYYRGRIVFTDTEATPNARLTKMNPGDNPIWIECGSIGEEGFGPLEDFGTPNAGCVDIQYRVRVPNIDPDADEDFIRVWASL